MGGRVLKPNYANWFPLQSEMYDLFAPRVNGIPLPSLLSIRDEKEYAYQKRLIANVYSLSSLTEYEPLVDGIIIKLMDQFKTKFDKQKGQSCDLGVWLRYCKARGAKHDITGANAQADAFDVIMQLSFSHNLGFIDHGQDVSGYMKMLDKNIDMAAIVRLLSIKTRFPGEFGTNKSRP